MSQDPATCHPGICCGPPVPCNRMALFQCGHKITECTVRPQPLPHYLWLRKLRYMDRRGLRVSAKEGAGLPDSWVFTPDSTQSPPRPGAKASGEDPTTDR